MTPEQKQRIAHEISNWRNARNDHSAQLTGDRMAALLQDLVDAPEVLASTNPSQISSSAEPFGYFKAEPFGWTDCAETDDGAIALYTAPPEPSVPDGWMRAIDEALVVHHIDIADSSDGYEEAKKKLNELLAINSDIARYCSEPPADVARDAARLDWLDAQCSENNGRHICCLPGGLRVAIDAAMHEKGQS